MPPCEKDQEIRSPPRARFLLSLPNLFFLDPFPCWRLFFPGRPPGSTRLPTGPSPDSPLILISFFLTFSMVSDACHSKSASARSVHFLESVSSPSFFLDCPFPSLLSGNRTRNLKIRAAGFLPVIKAGLFWVCYCSPPILRFPFPAETSFSVSPNGRETVLSFFLHIPLPFFPTVVPSFLRFRKHSSGQAPEKGKCTPPYLLRPLDPSPQTSI